MERRGRPFASPSFPRPEGRQAYPTSESARLLGCIFGGAWFVFCSAAGTIVASRLARKPADALLVRPRVLPGVDPADGLERGRGPSRSVALAAAVRHRRKPSELSRRGHVWIDLSAAHRLGGQARNRKDPRVRLVLPPFGKPDHRPRPRAQRARLPRSGGGRDADGEDRGLVHAGGASKPGRKPPSFQERRVSPRDRRAGPRRSRGRGAAHRHRRHEPAPRPAGNFESPRPRACSDRRPVAGGCRRLDRPRSRQRMQAA